MLVIPLTAKLVAKGDTNPKAVPPASVANLIPESKASSAANLL